MILRVEHGCFSYQKQEPILNDIHLEAHPGEIIAVLGPNGAGKTTLLKCLLGSLKWSSGCSSINGEDIRSPKGRLLSRLLSYVPQAKGLTSSLYAEEMILLGRTGHLDLFAVPREEDREKVRAVAEQLHIQGLLHKRCHEMSGGELQMVLIARALAAEPELIILDEPESNLDFRNQLILLDALSDMAKKGICCLFNTHYPAHALSRADRTLLLAKRGPALFGETARILTEENIAGIFGVRALIGELETGERSYRNILPVEVLPETRQPVEKEECGSVIAVLSMIYADNEEGQTGKVNTLLHAYAASVIGRMDLPCPARGLIVSHITLDAPAFRVQELTRKLMQIPGMSVKATIAPAADNLRKIP